jgi:hypothetical protein
VVRSARLSLRRAAASGLAALALAACATGPPVPPAYTQEELAERCVRTGGWWHGVPPDSLFSGFCEYQAPRFP